MNTMDTNSPTLCFPDHEKSCFACCPPIRPAGYEHIRYKHIIGRILRENTGAFIPGDEKIVPIRGFSCWALGYLDKGYRLVGCLLHPEQNGGVDLRYRVDYGKKCPREVCPEARAFGKLGVRERGFWLRLADGLDAFSYSSKGMNPLFSMMGWGPRLLGLISAGEDFRPFTLRTFLGSYPFFSTRIHPRCHAYLIRNLVEQGGVRILKREPFRIEFERFSVRLSERLRRECPHRPDGEPVHRLDLDRDFQDFLRLSIPVSRLHREDALLLKQIVDKDVQAFLHGIP